MDVNSSLVFWLSAIIVETLACSCSEPTTIQIQNYDGPIYVHIPGTPECDDSAGHPPPPYERRAQVECTCVTKPSIKCIPINTASESSCVNYNGGKFGIYNTNYNSGTYDTDYNSGTYNAGTHPLCGDGKGVDKIICTFDIVQPQCNSDSGYKNHCLCHKCHNNYN